MGIGVSIRNLFKSIFGKSKTSHKDNISQEVRKRAQELGISPEDYVKITKENGSIYGISDGDFGIPRSSSYDVGSETIDNLRDNLYSKYAEYGFQERGRQSFGLDQSVDNYRRNVEKGKEESEQETQQILNAQYNVAVEDLDAVEGTADRENKNAIASLYSVKQETDRENTQQQQLLSNAQAAADAGNASALAELDAAKANTQKQSDAAEEQLDNTTEEVEDKNNAAEAEVSDAKQTQSANNKEAEQKVSEAETDKNKTASTLSELTTQSSSLDNKISELEKVQNPNEGEQKELEKLRNDKKALEAKIDEAKKADEEAQKKLDESKEKKNTVATEGEQLVSDKTKKMETTKQEGEKQVADAESHVEQTKDQGIQTVQDSTAKVDKTKEQGVQAVERQENDVKAAQQQGQTEVKKAEKEVKTTEQKGKKQVESAKDNVRDAQRKQRTFQSGSDESKQNILNENSGLTKGQKSGGVSDAGTTNPKSSAKKVEEKAQEQLKKDIKKDIKSFEKKANNTGTKALEYDYFPGEYKQQSLGEVNDTSGIPVNKGNQARQEARARALQKNPNMNSAQLEVASKQELATMMQKTDAQNSRAMQRCFNNPPSQAKLAQAATDRYNQEVQQGNSTRTTQEKEALLPDNDMNNKMHMQGDTVGNCWAQSGVTSIAATKEGNEMLLSHMHRDASRGVTAVHLQEAENNGNGAGGSGIYTFTDKEIADAAKHFGYGDGNLTAYMLATEKYLQENPEARRITNGGTEGYATNGGINSRMYEIITGAKADYTNHNGYVNVGINRFAAEGNYNNKYTYSALCKAVGQGHTAGSLTVAATNGNSHSFSIVGVSSNGTLLVQEPNNRGVFNEMFTFLDKNGNRVQPFKRTTSINGRPTYECPKDVYQKYIVAGTIMRWK